MKKTLSFAAMHFSVAFTVAYILTGSVVIGGLLFSRAILGTSANARDSGARSPV